MAKEVNILIRAKNAMAAGLAKAGKSLQKFGQTVAQIGKAMAASFVAVGSAITAASLRAEAFGKQIGQIETLTGKSSSEIKKEVKGISAEFGLAKDELTKGLYDALSAGVPEDNVFEFMRTASKMAIAGASSTAESVDLLTTAMNAFGPEAGTAAEISDKLFTTVRLGKTTISELGQSFSQVAPLAASSGVSIDQVLAAVASLTKQGTPTAVAMTQIRAAIIAMNKELGDGWSETMTLQQAMGVMSNAAGGSASKLKELTGRVEGTLGILAMTGDQAAGAARDLDELTNAAGATDQAFGKMADKNPFDKLKQGVDNLIISVGDAALQALAPLIEKAAVAAQTFSAKIAEWANSGGVQAMVANIKNFAFEAKAQFITIGAYAEYGMKESLSWVKHFITVAGVAFKIFLQSQVNMWKFTTDTIGHFMAKLAAKIKGEDFSLPKPKLSDYQVQIEEIPKRTLKHHTELDNKLKAIEQKRLARQKANANAEIKVAEQTASKKIEAANEVAVAEAKADAGEAPGAGQLDVVDKIKQQVKDAKEKLAENQKIAKKNVGQILQEQKAREDAAKSWEKDAKRAAELRGRESRKTKLSKKDKEWLDAFTAIEKAKAGVQEAQGELNDAQKQLQALGQNNVLLDQVKTAVKDLNDDIVQLLKRE